MLDTQWYLWQNTQPYHTLLDLFSIQHVAVSIEQTHSPTMARKVALQRQCVDNGLLADSLRSGQWLWQTSLMIMKWEGGLELMKFESTWKIGELKLYDLERSTFRISSFKHIDWEMAFDVQCNVFFKLSIIEIYHKYM